MPIRFAESGNPHPTPAEYRQLVLAKAREIESGRWLTRVFEVTVGLACTIAVAIPTGSQAGATAGVISGLLALLIIGASRFAIYVLAGSHKLHCEQIDRHEEYRKEAAADLAAMHAEAASLGVERDVAVKAKEERPLQMVEARRCLDVLASWLTKQAESGLSDLSIHKCRYVEVLSGLLMQANPNWEDTDFNGKRRGNAGSFLRNKAGQVTHLRNHVNSMNDFNARWKPPEWIDEIARSDSPDLKSLS